MAAYRETLQGLARSQNSVLFVDTKAVLEKVEQEIRKRATNPG